MAFYINTNQQDCSREISVLLKKCILSYPHHWTDLVFLCIGTDRVTGDCLGPYVGHRLSSFCFPGIYVYGTLVQPVHALNLCDTRKEILSRHPDSLIIAVDASLGQKNCSAMEITVDRRVVWSVSCSNMPAVLTIPVI